MWIVKDFEFVIMEKNLLYRVVLEETFRNSVKEFLGLVYIYIYMSIGRTIGTTFFGKNNKFPVRRRVGSRGENLTAFHTKIFYTRVILIYKKTCWSFLEDHALLWELKSVFHKWSKWLKIPTCFFKISNALLWEKPLVFSKNLDRFSIKKSTEKRNIL